MPVRRPWFAVPITLLAMTGAFVGVNRLDDVDLRGDLEAAVAASEADGRGVVALTHARMMRWEGVGGPTNARAERWLGPGNPDLEGVYAAVVLAEAETGDEDVARMSVQRGRTCRWWPVTGEDDPRGRPETLLQACWESSAPQALPESWVPVDLYVD